MPQTRTGGMLAAFPRGGRSPQENGLRSADPTSEKMPPVTNASSWLKIVSDWGGRAGCSTSVVVVGGAGAADAAV